ncbi:Protein of unknown function [Lachnospiraceae bacterium]|nr:Protein of unknown function [Lachnospiraceae bacterium]
MNNPGRQVEIDIAKGFAILCMVLVHAEEYFYNESIPWAVQVIEFLGSPPAAPVFMLALGIGIVYSRNNTPKQLALRGLKLFALSYVYNFFVYALPHLIVYFRDGDSEKIPVAIEEFANVDILQFASLSFLTFALVKKLHMKHVHLVECTLLIVVVGEWITDHVTFPEGFPRYFFGLFFGINEAAFFPYCSWIIFPIAGYIFGKMLSMCYSKRVFYKNILKACAPVYFVLLLNSLERFIDFGQIKGDYQMSYYHMGLYGGICLVSFALSWIAACYFIEKKLPKAVIDNFKNLSTNITKIYVIQYAIIVYAYVFIAKEESVLGLLDAMFASIAIFVVSVKLANKISAIQKAKKQKALKN